MTTISALILTYNEEDNIEDCLKSLIWCNEIIVIDSYSDDQTVEIARKYTDKVYQRIFDDFASQRNYGLDKVSSEWVLVIDADERVTYELKEEIQQVLLAPQAEAYKIPFRNYFLGKWIRYCGWYPDYHLRLFKKEKARFVNKVHEKVDIKGDINKLSAAIDHYTYKSISQFIRKTDYYTTLAAKEMYLQGKQFNIFNLIFNPVWRFIKMFIVKRGYKEGIYGFILSVLYFFYTFLKYAKLWDIKNNGGK